MVDLNKIYFGDCISKMQDIDSESVDVILTDPPYLYLKNQKLDRKFDDKVFFDEAKRVLKKDGFIVLFGRGTSFYRWNTILADLGFAFKEEIIWNKIFCSSPVLPISRIHETVSIHSKGRGMINKVKIPYIEAKNYNINDICQDIVRLKSALRNTSDLDGVLCFLETNMVKKLGKRRNGAITVQSKSIQVQNVTSQCMQRIKSGMNEKSIIFNPHDRYSRIHPTQKPVRVLERILALVSKYGDIVLDPFSGSGSTAIACINSNREYIGYEIDKEYYDLCSNRIENHLKELRRN